MHNYILTIFILMYYSYNPFFLFYGRKFVRVHEMFKKKKKLRIASGRQQTLG